MMQIDFPAGHSMDTNWFAIDKNGNIGLFDSHSEGAFPIQVMEQTYWDELFYKHIAPISKGLKHLFLTDSVADQISNKCSTKGLERIMTEEYFSDGCILLLNEGKGWDDLRINEYFENSKDSFALLLSSNRPLFLISHTCNIQKNLITAIKKNVISKACDFTMFEDEGSEEAVTIGELGLFVYAHEKKDWKTEPYYKIHSADIPLNVSQLDKLTIDKIPHFKEIDFNQQKCIQPMEFFSCQSSCPDDKTPNDWIKKGYAKVKISEDEWAYCLLPVSDQMWYRMNLAYCDLCYKMSRDGHIAHTSLHSFQDYPPIVIIRDYYPYDYKEKYKYDNILKCLSDCLEIDEYNYYISHCVKSYNYNQRDDKRQFSKSTLETKFQNCHQHFKIEISTLQPLLLIAIEENVTDLLQRHYQIDNLTAIPCLCTIKIEEKSYPLLVVNNIHTADEKEELMNFLCQTADEIKVILAQQRKDISTPKPRIVRLGESD